MFIYTKKNIWRNLDTKVNCDYLWEVELFEGGEEEVDSFYLGNCTV